jgi:hypothetical protein
LKSDIPILTCYRDYTPPYDVERIVRVLLRYVPEEHLAGLDCIVLTNSTSTRKLRRGKTWSRSRKVRMVECLGFYHGRRIELLVDNILESLPASFMRWRIMRESQFGRVLYHEIGHYIHFTKRPEFREVEDVADEWGKRLMQGFVRRRYWYLRPFARPVRWGLNYFHPKPKLRRGGTNHE